MYVTLNVDFGRERGVFLIPQQALQRDTVGAYLLVVGAGGKVLRRNVSADNAEGTDWIVTSGLAAGDQVVVSGLQSIHEGGNATATTWQAKNAPPVHP
jgi:membrane fusion protein (multidrug efflux system)